ncbi:thioredoxin [Estrella lausannensis]|nr:thioredoxin [Estrella lausannensis]
MRQKECRKEEGVRHTMANQIKHLDDSNFESVIQNGVTLVDFYADWCGPCRMIAPIIEDLANEMSDKITVAKLDIESAQNTTAKFNVTSIPTIILFKGGEEVNRVVGVRDKDAFIEMISEAL